GMLRWLSLPAALGLLAALGFGSGTAAARAGCPLAEPHVLKQRSSVVIYSVAGDVYACLRPSGATRKLAGPARRFHITGRYVGYIRDGECEDCSRLRVIN